MDNFEPVTIAGWLVTANEDVLRSYLELSSQLPILVLLSDSRTQTSVRQAVETAVAGGDGRFAAIEIDIEQNPRLAQALGITAADALAAILAGQPAVISQGGIDTAKLPAILQQLAQLADQNGLNGRVRLDDEPAEQLSPQQQKAFDLLSAGDYQGARSLYLAILADAPADEMASSGLAQVDLMLRLQNPEADDTFRSADQLLAGNNASAAFELLLGEFASATAERREQLRARLIELLRLFPADDTVVLSARRRLTSLLF